MTNLQLIRALSQLSLLFSLNSLPAFGFTVTSADGNEKLRIEPYLNYRQAALIHRDSYLFNAEKDRDYIDQLYTTIKIVKEIPDATIAAVEPAVLTLRDNPGALQFRIDQAYIDADLSGGFHFIAGKKVEIRGVGNFFSPSDLLNEDEDFIDPLARRQGKNMTRVEWRKSSVKLGIGYIPAVAQAWRRGKVWLLTEASLWDADLGLQLTQNDERKTTLGFSAVRFFGETFEFHADGRFQSRQNQVSKQAEREYSNIPVESSSHHLIVGSRMVVTSSASLVAEYIKNSAGLNPNELSEYYTAQNEKKTNGETPNDPFLRLVGREYVALAGYDDKLLPKLRTSISAIYNIRDESSFVSLNAKFRSSPLATIGYAPLWFVGKRLSEFGENPLQSIHYFTVESAF